MPAGIILSAKVIYMPTHIEPFQLKAISIWQRVTKKGCKTIPQCYSAHTIEPSFSHIFQSKISQKKIVKWVIHLMWHSDQETNRQKSVPSQIFQLMYHKARRHERSDPAVVVVSPIFTSIISVVKITINFRPGLDVYPPFKMHHKSSEYDDGSGRIIAPTY